MSRYADLSQLKRMSDSAAGDYLALGYLLVGAYLCQYAAHFQWPWLTALQSSDVYKQVSGFALLAYIAQQWHLSVLRSRGLMQRAGRLLRRHRLLGSVAPAFLYAHTQVLGFGYQAVLALLFLGVSATGLIQQEALRLGGRPLWLVAHVSLATALLFLLAYHVYITYAYQ